MADSGNVRVQLFQWGQRNATTVAGNWSLGTIPRNSPRGITLDDDDYLFILDSGNNRIIGSGPYGFRCLVGCSGSKGPWANQPNSSGSFSFGNMGNIFVVDTNNNRIQKFMLLNGRCGKYERKSWTEISNNGKRQYSVVHYLTSVLSRALTHWSFSSTSFGETLLGDAHLKYSSHVW